MPIFTLQDRCLFWNYTKQTAQYLSSTIYKFQLQVWNIGQSKHLLGTPGSAEVEVPVNAPPAVGTCASTPTSGMALSQVFRMHCTGWEDDKKDFPLLYSFYRVLEDGAMVQIGLPQGSNELSTVLGPTENPSGKVWIEGRVADRFGISFSKTPLVCFAELCLAVFINIDEHCIIITCGRCWCRYGAFNTFRFQITLTPGPCDAATTGSLVSKFGEQVAKGGNYLAAASNAVAAMGCAKSFATKAPTTAPTKAPTKAPTLSGAAAGATTTTTTLTHTQGKHTHSR